jgi:hypothetical protein
VRRYRLSFKQDTFDGLWAWRVTNSRGHILFGSTRRQQTRGACRAAAVRALTQLYIALRGPRKKSERWVLFS